MGETACEIDFEQFFVDYMISTHNPLFLEMNKSYVHLYMTLFGVPETPSSLNPIFRSGFVATEPE